MGVGRPHQAHPDRDAALAQQHGGAHKFAHPLVGEHAADVTGDRHATRLPGRAEAVDIDAGATDQAHPVMAQQAPLPQQGSIIRVLQQDVGAGQWA